MFLQEVSGVLDKTALAQPGTTPRNQPDVAIGQVDHSAAASHGGDVGKAGLEESADHMTKPKLVAKKKPIVVEETDIMAFYLPMVSYATITALHVCLIAAAGRLHQRFDM